MFCPNCGALVQDRANYCPNCGMALATRPFQPESGRQKLRPRLDILLLSIVLSLGLTFILTVVFDLPIFIFGAFLPFFWIGWKQRR